MQQTEKYKLNLIESSDPFLPDGLNQNTQKVEDTLNAFQNVLYAMEDVQNGFDQRLGAHGKNCRIAWGTYRGNDKYGADNPNRLTTDFCPVWVMIGSFGGCVSPSGPAVLMRGMTNTKTEEYSGQRLEVTWLDNGVSWYNTVSQTYQMSESSKGTYYYVAIGYDKTEEDA